MVAWSGGRFDGPVSSTPDSQGPGAVLGRLYDKAKEFLIPGPDPSESVVDHVQWPGEHPADFAKREALTPSHQAMAMQTATMAAPIAFHGSPHVFDKFDMSKIGTGEGAQAYGHGLYFTSEPRVAEGYRKELLRKGQGLGNDIDSLHMRLADQRRFLADFEAGNMDHLDAPATRRTIEELTKKIEEAKVRAGSFHQVDIPDNLLDWEKPLAQQPKAIKDALINSGSVDKAMRYAWGESATERRSLGQYMRGVNGGRLYRDLEDALGTGSDAAATLRAAGIPGHSYIGDSSGVRNFVMYDDQAIKPLGRYATMAEFEAAQKKPKD